ncbi:MAG TPA: CHAP domain-containing protein [Oscillospiraceae bacterium]|nr:CHAP domain-containing protein [Oscillospiraceae bacterium]HPS34148.1 CHAP domain-containing protein [Oscillospiraceae bacterium]
MRRFSQKTITLLAALLMTAGAFGCSSAKGESASSSPDQITLGSLSGYSTPAASAASSSSMISSAPSVVSAPSKASSASSVTPSGQPREISLGQFIEAFISIAEQQPQYPVKDGKTIYGELFGNPHAQWCTEFVMYCLKQAETQLGTSFIDTVYPWNDSAYATGLWFKRKNRYYDAHGSFIPARGDLIVFDSEYAGYPNHIGIVTGTATENGIAYITTIEGNIPEDEVKQIRRRKLAVTDPIIMGYCSTAVTAEYTGPLDQY